jgi:hypothetical protein
LKSKKTLIKISILLLVITGIILAIANINSIQRFFTPKDILKADEIKTELGDKIKSGSLSLDYNISKVIDDIYKFKLNTINLPVEVDVNTNLSNDMNVNVTSENKALLLIKKLKRLHINVILEPYPFIKQGEIPETKWNPTDINTWFWNWKTKVLRLLINDISSPYNVYSFNIASNFVHMEYAQGYWSDTIDYVKKSYKGLVSFRTNWWTTAVWKKSLAQEHEAITNNSLFTKVDFISIAAYFELTDKPTNSVKTLTDALYSSTTHKRKQNIYQEIKDFHLKTGKQIFFGEIGFPKRNGAATTPWSPSPSNIVNEQEQANCFEAYKNVFAKEKWITGISIFSIGYLNENSEYYPGKESTNVIRDWFTKQIGIK